MDTSNGLWLCSLLNKKKKRGEKKKRKKISHVIPARLGLAVLCLSVRSTS